MIEKTCKLTCNLHVIIIIIGYILYIGYIFQLPYYIEIVPYETVVTELEADTVQHGAAIGIRRCSRFVPGEFPDALFVCIKVSYVDRKLFTFMINTILILVIVNHLLINIHI